MAEHSAGPRTAQRQAGRLVMGSLWIGAPWSFLEQVVLQSYVDAGHAFVLFGDTRPEHLPAGAEFVDYRDVVTPPFPVGPGQYHNNGVFSDLFRLILIRDHGFCWVDMDAYCVRSFDFAPGSHVFAPEVGDDPPPYVANGILHLPQDSPTLDECIALFHQDNPELPWQTAEDETAASEARAAGRPFRIERAAWATSGPYLLSHVLRKHDELRHALPMTHFYGGMRSRRRPFTRPGVPVERIELPGAYSVHFYGRTRRFLLQENGGLPPEGSYLRLLCRRHGIDPGRLPVRG
jgi:hypothetical protein